MLWLGFIEIDKIMMNLIYFLPSFFRRLVGIGRGTASIAVIGGQYYTSYFLIY
jgi:hypothetical protein